MTENLNSKLNDLYQYLQDSRNGYQECAASVDDRILKQKLQDLASKRQTMLDELRNCAAQVGVTLKDSGSTEGFLHRLFIDIKSLLSGGDKNSIINEIERGESYLIDAYQKVLLENFASESLKSICERQLEQVKTDVQQVKLRNTSP